MSEHETIRVRIDRQYFDIDKDIAALVVALNLAGIVTCQSCQEREPGLAWLVFWDTTDVARFLEITRKNYKPELEVWDEGDEEKPSIAINLYILFPKEDIPELVERFRAAKLKSPRKGKK